MKIVIDIPEEVITAIQNGEDYRYDIHTAIAQGTPYEERPTGDWINGDDKCPCCGKSKFEGLDADIWADWQPEFCPNCGADMRGISDGTN